MLALIPVCRKFGISKVFYSLRYVLTLQWLLKLIIKFRSKYFKPTEIISKGIDEIVENDPEIVDAIIESENDISKQNLTKKQKVIQRENIKILHGLELQHQRILALQNDKTTNNESKK